MPLGGTTHIPLIALKHLEGDSPTYSVIISMDPALDGDDPDETLEIVRQDTMDPTNDPQHLDGGGGDGFMFDNTAKDGHIYIKFLTKGGDGGNKFRARVHRR